MKVRTYVRTQPVGMWVYVGVGLVLALTNMTSYVQYMCTYIHCCALVPATCLPHSVTMLCCHALLPGTKNVVCAKQMELLKSGCVVGNMGHSNHEIDVVSTVCVCMCHVCVCVTCVCTSVHV